LVFCLPAVGVTVLAVASGAAARLLSRLMLTGLVAPEERAMPLVEPLMGGSE
jgi:hypothetical protein